MSFDNIENLAKSSDEKRSKFHKNVPGKNYKRKVFLTLN